MRIVTVIAVVCSLLTCPFSCAGAFCVDVGRQADVGGCCCCHPDRHADPRSDVPDSPGDQRNCICHGALPVVMGSDGPVFEESGCSFFAPPETRGPAPLDDVAIQLRDREPAIPRLAHGPGGRALRTEFQSFLF